MTFDGLNPPYGAILADPPWTFKAWYSDANTRSVGGAYRRVPPYRTMSMDDIKNMPVKYLAGDACILFMWICWVHMPESLEVIKNWGFEYKTCAFSWMKANGKQIDLFHEDITPDMLLGYWTRSNSEVCLLATRGSPKRLNMDVRQGIVEPRREHSRKPDCVYERIERLVAGPYLELFARNTRPGWDSWGNEVGKFAEVS